MDREWTDKTNRCHTLAVFKLTNNDYILSNSFLYLVRRRRRVHENFPFAETIVVRSAVSRFPPRIKIVYNRRKYLMTKQTKNHLLLNISFSYSITHTRIFELTSFCSSHVRATGLSFPAEQRWHSLSGIVSSLDIIQQYVQYEDETF